MRRSRHAGSVFRRRYQAPDGSVRLARTWTVQWSDAQGRRHKEPTKAATKAEAEMVLREKLQARDAGRGVAPVLTTLDDILAIIEADYTANQRRSLPRVQQAATQLRDFFGAKERAALITEARVTAYVSARLAAKAKPATVNRELAALRRAFRLAKRAGKVERRPDFSLLAEHNVRKGFLGDEQLDALVAALPADLRPPVRVAYLTGWRMFSEVLTRQWRHVDLDAGWLRLEPGEGKTQTGRMFPFTPELRAILKAQRDRTDELERAGSIIPWVFHRGGARIRAIRRAWLTACRKAGLATIIKDTEGKVVDVRPHVIPHDLRRSAVRNMERAGIPRSAAMAMVGHKTESVYRRYAIADETMLRDAALRLGASRGLEARGRAGSGGGRRRPKS